MARLRPQHLVRMIVTPRTTLPVGAGLAASGSGSASSVSAGAAGVSASTSSAGLSSRSPLKAACRTMPVPGPAGELDLGDQARHPVHPRRRPGRAPSGERTFLLLGREQLRHQLATFAAPNPVPTRPR